MNTRLQVEHPVTECVTGLDLVALQIAVAEGRVTISPSRAAERPRRRGAALRRGPGGRLAAAERHADPLRGPRRRRRAREPGATGIRLDSGVARGDEIGTHYDAMIAKVIAWAPTRDDAFRRLAGA